MRPRLRSLFGRGIKRIMISSGNVSPVTGQQDNKRHGEDGAGSPICYLSPLRHLPDEGLRQRTQWDSRRHGNSFLEKPVYFSRPHCGQQMSPKVHHVQTGTCMSKLPPVNNNNKKKKNRQLSISHCPLSRLPGMPRRPIPTAPATQLHSPVANCPLISLVLTRGH